MTRQHTCTTASRSLPVLAAATVFFVVASVPLRAERIREPGDGTEAPPCPGALDSAVASIQLDLIGDPLRGCTVEISAGRTEIQVIQDFCHNPISLGFPASIPYSWELVSYPAGTPPAFSATSTLASLSLPRRGFYEVRFTVCPSSSCIVERPGTDLPLQSTSQIIRIQALDLIPLPPERNPRLPPSTTAGTSPTTFPDKDCRCQAGGGFVDPQWVTTREWNGSVDYELLEGEVIKSWISSADNPLNHDSQDVNFNVRPDPRFRYLLSTEPEFADPLLMGVEWERASWPERLRPLAGDRVSVFGYWILDCGHSGFYTEIHPAVGVAVHRPTAVEIPSGRQFTFDFGNEVFSSSAGTNVIVPGITTEIWFNRDNGEATRNCSTSGLHQPATCVSSPGPMPGVIGYIDGDCISGPAPLDRIFEFRIYLPRSPQSLAGVSVPRAPLYFEVSNPFGHAGEEPQVLEETEDGVTYLRVRLDLRSLSESTYHRTIRAAWVYADADNWGVRPWDVLLHCLDVHNDLDEYIDHPNDAGDWRLWLQTPASPAWTRILDGDDNAQGKMTFNPPWQTGSADPEFWRPLAQLDPLRRLGAPARLYPGDRVFIAATAFEYDPIESADPGRVILLLPQQAGRHVATSSKGYYSIDVELREGTALPRAELSAAAQRLYQSLGKTCDTGDRVHVSLQDSVIWYPTEENDCLVNGLARYRDWRVAGAPPGAALGARVASAGDINGDRMSDFLVSSPDFDNGFENAGRVELFSGYGGVPSTSPAFAVEGASVGAALGSALASGDVDDDDFSDIVVGASGADSVFLWRGGASGLSGEVDTDSAWWRATGQAGSSFGAALAVGDIDGDGFDDVVVGAPLYLNDPIRVRPRGRVFAYLGPLSGEAGAPDWSHASTAPFLSTHHYGFAVALADVNTDGFDDLVVGAPHFSNGLDGSPRGAIFFFTGSSSGFGTTPTFSFESDVPGGLYGISVANAGDVNRDGREDVVVGASNYFIDDIFLNEGAAFVYLGFGSGSVTPSQTYLGRNGDSGFGSWVAGAGDVNGDGFDDVLIGAPLDRRDRQGEGRLSLYLGSSAGLGAEAWRRYGGELNAAAGTAASSAGDVDGDGWDDIVWGAPGEAGGSGSAYLKHGCGAQEVRLTETRAFRAVGAEEYVLFNFFDDDYAQRLEESHQTDPEKLRRVLIELREEYDELGDSANAATARYELGSLRRLFPPALWDEYFSAADLEFGGALFLDAGGSEATMDLRGRRWKQDAPFLASTGNDSESFAGQQIDATLLSDQAIPNNVLLSERSYGGDIRYEIPAPAGKYRVTLYMSENCTSCVSPRRGGSACETCARIVDLEVEGVRQNAYDAADAALPPTGDGVGTTFRATEVVFEDVFVTDEILDIAVLDRGTGNPPGNASIKALKVERVIQGGQQLPGDCNQDGVLDISDAVCLLGYLFRGSPSRLPCGDGGDAANVDLADVNGDGAINISDPTAVVGYLFLGRGPPARGTECNPVAGCLDNPRCGL